jgi:hypothetical protein
MRENWRATLPLTLFPVALSIIYLLTYSLDLTCMRFGWRMPRDIYDQRLFLLSLIAGCHGIYRVISFHPFYNSQYRKWLCVTPWSPDRPLPQGPIHLIWTDVLTLGVLSLLAYTNIPELSAVPIMAFLGVY